MLDQVKCKYYCFAKTYWFDIRNISEKLAIPKSTVVDLIKRAKYTDEPWTLRHGRCGRKRKTTPQDVKVTLRNSVKNPKKTSKDLLRDQP